MPLDYLGSLFFLVLKARFWFYAIRKMWRYDAYCKIMIVVIRTYSLGIIEARFAGCTSLASWSIVALCMSLARFSMLLFKDTVFLS